MESVCSSKGVVDGIPYTSTSACTTTISLFIIAISNTKLNLSITSCSVTEESGSYHLRSNTSFKVKVSKAGWKTFKGSQACALVGSSPWNTLPAAIRSILRFKLVLKASLICLSFAQIKKKTFTVVAVLYFPLLYVNCVLCQLLLLTLSHMYIASALYK